MAFDIQAYQIYYDEKTRATLDPDFEPLDNLKNERPDWYEYWPIRNYLAQNRLDGSAYYGFLSPSFNRKTRLTGKQVKDFVERADGAEVVTFSPYPCQAASFLNVFEQADYWNPGLLHVAAEFFGSVDPEISLDTLVTHSRNTVFSNYFLAKGSFWNQWREILDRLFELAEGQTTPLFPLLTGQTDYIRAGKKDPVQTKVFVMERAVSWLLVSRTYTTKTFPPFQMPISPQFRDHMADIVMLDSLKIAYSSTRDDRYLVVYRAMQERVIGQTWQSNRIHR